MEENQEQTNYDKNETDWKTMASEGKRDALNNYENLDAMIDAKQSFEVSARSKSTIPTNESTDEVWTEYYGKMAPATIDEYKYDLAEGVEPIQQMDDIKNAAKLEGITTRQFGKLAPVVDGVIQSTVEAVVAQYAPSDEDCVKELTTDWKGDTEKNIKMATSAFSKFGGEALTKWLQDTGIGNQPLLVRAFQKIAEATMDDTLVDGSPGNPAPTKKESPYSDAFNQRYKTEAPA